MSVNSRMVRVKVFRLVETITASGAHKKDWIPDAGTTPLAVYPLDQQVSTDRYRHTEGTHAGLTHRRGLIAGRTRIQTDAQRFIVLSVDDTHRLSQLVLKEMQTW